MRGLRRRVDLIAVVAACTLFAGACASSTHKLAPATPAQPALPASDHDLTHYIALPGDQVVTVPNGVYSGGSVTAPHAETSGSHRGWLILVAQSRQGAIVDLANTPLTLESGTTRVLFVGFKFVNGIVIVRGDDLGFWYTEHTFPIEEWNRQFKDAGGDANAIKRLPNGVPKTIWIGEESDHTALRTMMLGVDIHDVGDDGVFVDHSEGALIQGARIWNVDVKGYDPGYNPWNAGIKELIHNDSVQIPGSVTDFTMADSYAGQTITVGGDNANASNLTWSNLWIAHSSSVGMDFYVRGGYRINGTIRDIRAWSNGLQHPADPGYDQLRVDFVDAKEATWPDSLHDARLDIVSRGTNLNQQPPSGIAMSGRRMDDQSQALNSVLNPANAWRSAHPYNSWPAYFHFPTPRSEHSS